ncbi:MAG: AAA family ATPase [Candidatus Heimdallarchaeota archaeon]|nr:AAA family ATPase [Candidatus Heimdallarchaeota archaeon]
MTSNNSDNFLRIKTKKDKYEYFSKGILSSSLYSIGISANLALEVANQVEKEISSASETPSKKKLIKIITSAIEKIDNRLAERYIVFEGEEKYKPIIILLAGVPGIGKSTLSVDLSKRLEITNIIGTDMVREILRQTISSKLIPELHSSSYEAYKYLKPTINPILRQSIVGYEEQCRHVIVGVEAAIQSALYSRENTIIEGVHLAPNILNRSILEESHVILILFYLENEEEHLRRIKSRGSEVKQRGADRYLSSFQEIRNIQTYLVEEANKLNIPIIETSDGASAIEKMMDIVWERILFLENKVKE